MTDDRDAEAIKTITFGRKEIDPEEEAKYREQIAAARKAGINQLKGSTPLGHVERPPMPFLQKGDNVAALPSGLSESGGVQPRPPGSPILSPQTAHQLTQMGKAQAAEKDAATKIEEETKKEIDAQELMDEFINAGRPGREMEQILDNQKRRKAIESRCAEMKIDDLILKGEVQQVVPIIAGKFEVRYRSITPEENLFIKELVAKTAPVSDQHTLEKFTYFQLCCSIVSINGDAWPGFKTAEDKLDEKLFYERLKRILKMSGYVVQDLAINYGWFDIRVRRLLNPENLGNG